MVTTSLDVMIKCLAIVCEFIDAFCLSLARLKSSLWGSDVIVLRVVSEQSGIPVAQQVKALGATWQVTRKAKASFEAEAVWVELLCNTPPEGRKKCAR